jgi:DNA-directed RNA polymerase specialized sigma24 family protein
MADTTVIEDAHRNHARRLRRLVRRHGMIRADAEDALQDAYVRMLATETQPRNAGAWGNAVDSSAALDLARREARERTARAALTVTQMRAEDGVLATSGAYKQVEYNEPVTQSTEPWNGDHKDVRYAPPPDAIHPYREDPTAVEESRQEMAREAHDRLAQLAQQAQLGEAEVGALLARHGYRTQPWSDVAKLLGVRRQRVLDVTNKIYQRLVAVAGADCDVATIILRASYATTERE